MNNDFFNNNFKRLKDLHYSMERFINSGEIEDDSHLDYNLIRFKLIFLDIIKDLGIIELSKQNYLDLIYSTTPPEIKIKENIPEVVILEYKKLYVKLTNLFISITHVLTKLRYLMVVEDDSLNNKYRCKKDLRTAMLSHDKFLKKLSLNYIYTIRELKNICINMLEKKQNVNLTKEDFLVNKLYKKIDKQLSFIRKLLKEKNIIITNIVLNETSIPCTVYVKDEDYSDVLNNLLFYSLLFQYKQTPPLISIKSFKTYKHSSFSVDITNRVLGKE